MNDEVICVNMGSNAVEVINQFLVILFIRCDGFEIPINIVSQKVKRTFSFSYYIMYTFVTVTTEKSDISNTMILLFV